MGFFPTLSDFSSPSSSQRPKVPVPDLAAVGYFPSDGAYTTSKANWYTAKPYGFRWHRRDGKNFTMFLPINPSNINITTPFATNVIPTLYGTVEEHSDIRYYDIVIEGTTGMAPKFVYPINTNDDSSAYQTLKEPGRATFPIRDAILGGLFSKTIAQVQNIVNTFNKAISTISGNTPQVETALYTDQSGYIAFHNLYLFLKQYKRDAAGISDNTPLTQHPLKFFNYKDNNEYDVAIRSFTLRRSAENPMLYNYSITMRGYNLNTVGSNIANDREKDRLEALGLLGVKSSTLLSTVKSLSSNAKNIVGNVISGGKGLGG